MTGFPMDAYNRPGNLPSNVTLLWEGKMTARVFRDALFKNLTGYVDLSEHGEVNVVASGIKYTDLWRRECAERFPRTHFEFAVEPGDGMAMVSLTDNHPRQEEVMTTAMRLGHELAARWGDWVVFVGSPDEAAIVAALGEPVATAEAVDDPANPEF